MVEKQAANSKASWRPYCFRQDRRPLTQCTPATGVVVNVLYLVTQYLERGGQHQFGVEGHIFLVFAILSDYRGVAAYRPDPGNAEVKFIILSHRKIRIEPTHLIENAASE
jgi:hypothetical protein